MPRPVGRMLLATSLGVIGMVVLSGALDRPQEPSEPGDTSGASARIRDRIKTLPKKSAPPEVRKSVQPSLEGVRIDRDLEYTRIGDRSLKLDLYRPENVAEGAKLPVVVWVHGGAWLTGSKAGTPAARLVAQGGYAVASVEYRLSPEATFPAQIADCKAAIRWLRANADDYGLDRDRVAAWGASAGGHLVALLGTAGDVEDWENVGGHRDQSSRVQAVVDYFGPTDFLTMDEQGGDRGVIRHDARDSPESRLIGGPIRDNPEKVAAASPLTYVTRDDPPFLIVHGTEDFTVPIGQSEQLVEALEKAGVPVEIIRVQGAGHGDFGPHHDPPAPVIFERVRQFLDVNLDLKAGGSRK